MSHSGLQLSRTCSTVILRRVQRRSQVAWLPVSPPVRSRAKLNAPARPSLQQIGRLVGRPRRLQKLWRRWLRSRRSGERTCSKSSTACWRLFSWQCRTSRFAIASGWKMMAGNEGRRTLGIHKKHIDDRQNAGIDQSEKLERIPV